MYKSTWKQKREDEFNDKRRISEALVMSKFGIVLSMMTICWLIVSWLSLK